MTYKAVVSRPQQVSYPMAMPKVTEEGKGPEHWEDDLWKPFIAECTDGNNTKELNGVLRYSRISVHGIEQCNVGEDTWVVDGGRPHENVSE